MVLLLLFACGGNDCPTGAPLSFEDLPCDCAGTELEMFSSCGTLTCDEDAGVVYVGGECGDSG